MLTMRESTTLADILKELKLMNSKLDIIINNTRSKPTTIQPTQTPQKNK